MNRNLEVERWFDEAERPLEGTLRRAREIILAADDRVTESEIPGDHPSLEGDGRLARTMRFADSDQLEAGRAELEAVIRAWCDSGDA